MYFNRKKVRLGDREVSDFSRPYIVAEIGSNFNGDIELAKKLIQLAKENGADAVKFQSWTKESLFTEQFYKEHPDVEEQVEKWQLKKEDHWVLKEFADKVGIEFFSTPVDFDTVDFLVDELGVKMLKVASMDLNNIPLLKHMAKKGVPIILSTGMGTLEEITKAVKAIEEEGNEDIVILHCVSLYPPRDEEVNLLNMDLLRNVFPYPIGFSDHTLGITIPLAAIARGASLIEKHFTIDKNMEGWDHKVSMTPEELRTLREEGDRIIVALGSYMRVLSDREKEKSKVMRRSIVAARDIAKGEVIELKDLAFKRPGTGLEPWEYKYIVGRKAKREIKKDEFISLDMVE